MEIIKRECQYCMQVFTDMSGKVFSNHVRWCEKNPSRNNTDNIKKANKRYFDNKLGELKEFDVICCKCGIVFKSLERSKKFPERNKYFCSIQCSNTRIVTDNVKQKISLTLTGRVFVARENRVCLWCSKTFEVRETDKSIFCNRNCCNLYKRKDFTKKKIYRKECQFKFNVYHFPQEFNLDLIREHGWYKAKNRGDNLDGVSRDHKISIDCGWSNNISIEIISHPANCELVRHSVNCRKNINCSIDLTTLIGEIKRWDELYEG